MISFPRMHADERGETHIGVREIPTHDAALGPPPNPVGRMTAPIGVSSLVTYSAPAGTGGHVAQRAAALHLHHAVRRGRGGGQ